jgi:hypothetical protein
MLSGGPALGCRARTYSASTAYVSHHYGQLLFVDVNSGILYAIGFLLPAPTSLLCLSFRQRSPQQELGADGLEGWRRAAFAGCQPGCRIMISTSYHPDLKSLKTTFFQVFKLPRAPSKSARPRPQVPCPYRPKCAALVCNCTALTQAEAIANIASVCLKGTQRGRADAAQAYRWIRLQTVDRCILKKLDFPPVTAPFSGPLTLGPDSCATRMRIRAKCLPPLPRARDAKNCRTAAIHFLRVLHEFCPGSE